MLFGSGHSTCELQRCQNGWRNFCIVFHMSEQQLLLSSGSGSHYETVTLKHNTSNACTTTTDADAVPKVGKTNAQKATCDNSS